MTKERDRLLARSPACWAADPWLHQGFSLIQSQASPLRPLAQRLTTVTGRLQQRQQLTSGHPAEGDSRRTFPDPEVPKGCGIGSSSELEGPRRRDRNHLAPELDGSTRRTRTDITAHRTAIELPERAKAKTAKASISLPELLAELSGRPAMSFKAATHC